MGGLPGAAVLQVLRAAPQIEVAGIVRSARWDAFERVRVSGIRYGAYLGCSVFAPDGAGALPQHATRDCNDAASRAFIARLDPQLVVSAYFNLRLATERPAVNIHPALLPALRGVDPVFYALLRGAPLGVTLHRLVHEFDAGPLVAQREAPRVSGESVLGATVRLFRLGAHLLVESLAAIGAGVAEPQRGVASYDSWPTRRDVAALRGKGFRLVSWRDLLARAP